MTALSARSQPSRQDQLARFLNEVVGVKLARRGSAAILTDQHEALEDLAELIQQDPTLSLLEVSQRSTRLPLRGGKAVLTEDGEALASWLVYRRRSLSSFPPPPPADAE